MFPIRDLTGRPIAFGGRTLSKKEGCQVLPARGILYHKGDVLFGTLGKPAIAKKTGSCW